MSANASDGDRYAPGGVTSDGSYRFDWNLTSRNLIDPVKLVLPPNHVLPVVFVPGIMGSNLRKSSDHKTPVWRLDEMHGWKRSMFNHGPAKDQPIGLAWDMRSMKPGARQKLMHPDRVEVDPTGHVPSKPAGSITNASDYTERGWGEVGESSYHTFLLWLEEHLNGQGYDPAKWKDFYFTSISAAPKPGEVPPEPKLFPGTVMTMTGLPNTAEIGNTPAPVTSDDLLKRAGFRMPVYACGYNWLASNQKAAEALQVRINKIIAENNKGKSKCSQVILVTHSMGGLVARACQKLDGMRESIAGIVHGVMPTVGAAVAYRRCKVGMKDEDPIGGMAIGEDGPSVTAVFAQAPGALQLLPTAQYQSGWLSFTDQTGRNVVGPKQPAKGDPYHDIYLNQDKWWGLIRKEWLSPQNGITLNWANYAKNVAIASEFHAGIKDGFHPNTYVFYGKDSKQKSFEGIQWVMTPGLAPDDKAHPTLNQLPDLGFEQVRDDGTNPLYVGGGMAYQPPLDPLSGGGATYETSYWELQCAQQDGGGDGTVPVSSGAAPGQSGNSAIKQQFGLNGFKHEGAYRNSTVQVVALYALQKIASAAKVPA